MLTLIKRPCKASCDLRDVFSHNKQVKRNIWSSVTLHSLMGYLVAPSGADVDFPAMRGVFGFQAEILQQILGDLTGEVHCSQRSSLTV